MFKLDSIAAALEAIEDESLTGEREKIDSIARGKWREVSLEKTELVHSTIYIKSIQFKSQANATSVDSNRIVTRYKLDAYFDYYYILLY